jgi:hypothetical protein
MRDPYRIYPSVLSEQEIIEWRRERSARRRERLGLFLLGLVVGVIVWAIWRAGFAS